MLFPELRGKRFGTVVLEALARKHERSHPELWRGASPFYTDSAFCSQLIAAEAKRVHMDFLYGGHLEDRSTLWRGSYLRPKHALHLGVDFTVPSETVVTLDENATVAVIGSDAIGPHPEEGGWGGFVIVALKDHPVHLIYAHLHEPLVTGGASLNRGAVLGRVGEPPHNGGWFPHLHLQAIANTEYARLLEGNFAAFDGYGRAADRERLTRAYPDPMPYVQLR